MNIVTWNVNGIRACVGKEKKIFETKADVYCFQEIKASEEQVNTTISSHLLGYEHFVFPAQKKGYAGVSIHTRKQPLRILRGIQDTEFDAEGRVLTLEFQDFYLVNVYFPHAHRELRRLDFKLRFNNKFQQFCETLKKPIIVAADFNVAHNDVDLKNPRQNEGNAGFTTEERKWFDEFLKFGFIDSFRLFNHVEGHYTWWPYAFNARERNIGWRIDYAIVSKQLSEQVEACSHLYHVKGSDHCPVMLTLRKR